MSSLFYLRERKKLDVQFKEDREKQREVDSQINYVYERITMLEKETSIFLKQCQELFNNEISKVRY